MFYFTAQILALVVPHTFCDYDYSFIVITMAYNEDSTP